MSIGPKDTLHIFENVQGLKKELFQIIEPCVVIGTGEYLESTDDADNDKPEPEEDVDFLVDDVQGEDAESVEPFNSTRRTELVEGAFCDLHNIHNDLMICT